MNPVFGIHVGNSGACLAMCKKDDSKFQIEVIANHAGERVTPAIVTVTENENVVGTACKSLMISRWNTTVVCNKRMLDTNTPELENGHRRVATVLREDELCYELPLEDRTEYMTPTDIARSIFRTLYEIARSAVPGAESEASCVLLVPRLMSDEGRFKLRSAAEAVGWDVMHIICEPAAAILGYDLLSDCITKKVLVYRVGGRSCDVTLIQVDRGFLNIQDTEYTEDVGGKLLINTLTNYLAQEFYRKYKLDPKESHRSLTKLTLAAENCLHVLSSIESANCFVESLCEGVDFSHQMSRARFESLLNPFLVEFAKPLHSVLSRQNLTPDDVTMVLLCGGPMKMPKLRKYISEIFQESKTKIVPLLTGVNYDEVLACGAARQAGYIADNNMGDNFLPDQLEIPVLEFAITIKVEGAQSDRHELESGLFLPIHKTMRVSSPEELVTLTFSQFETDQTILRGQLQLEGLPDPCYLELEVNSEDGLKVGVPEEGEDYRHHIVKMRPIPL
ncbi:heat shock 70 kDa protein 14-like [Macrosteles quadrilineatus]|uniref:heat shock 70 kDa protein 14-like n=1 Tax=Macrosteles quadrilineatus TaxID=74068 RepID=UPI0023E25C2A|nr:heat shock 70 kDa protein 14-like [Macrosteles quadrilineatus]XP_054280855.1 heat shock 70 kDa protein 14-like [Macrosteles quadrilineatus]